MSTGFYHILVHYIAKGFYLTTTYPNCNATLCGGLKHISEPTRAYKCLLYDFQVTDQLMDSPIDEDDQSTDKQHPRGEEVPELTSGGLVTLQ